jgi:hypothetical protein
VEDTWGAKVVESIAVAVFVATTDGKSESVGDIVGVSAVVGKGVVDSIVASVVGRSVGAMVVVTAVGRNVGVMVDNEFTPVEGPREGYVVKASDELSATALPWFLGWLPVSDFAALAPFTAEASDFMVRVRDSDWGVVVFGRANDETSGVSVVAVPLGVAFFPLKLDVPELLPLLFLGSLGSLVLCFPSMVLKASDIIVKHDKDNKRYMKAFRNDAALQRIFAFCLLLTANTYLSVLNGFSHSGQGMKSEYAYKLSALQIRENGTQNVKNELICQKVGEHIR